MPPQALSAHLDTTTLLLPIQLIFFDRLKDKENGMIELEASVVDRPFMSNEVEADRKLLVDVQQHLFFTRNDVKA